MNFADKLKELRKSKNMSQEQLAEKLYVSRQAITKWENGTGLPDIENIIAISTLFNESLDSLLSEEKSLMSKNDFLYQSLTQYDLDCSKEIDFNFGIAHEVIIERTTAEKIEIQLASNRMNYLNEQLKVKIEENKKRMSAFINRAQDLTDLTAKRDLFVILRIPQKFVAHLEVSGITENLRIRDICLNNLEFGGKLSNGFISNVTGHLEIDTNNDSVFEVKEFKGKLDINQWKATSVITVQNSTFDYRRIGNNVRFLDENNQLIDVPNFKKIKKTETTKNSNNDFVLEIAGFKSELKVIKQTIA